MRGQALINLLRFRKEEKMISRNSPIQVEMELNVSSRVLSTPSAISSARGDDARRSGYKPPHSLSLVESYRRPSLSPLFSPPPFSVLRR